MPSASLAISQALYKLYRLGGYGLVQEASAAATVAATSNLEDALGPVSVMDCGDEARSDRDDGHEYEDETERARFVAFVLHSLAGESLRQSI